MEVSPDSEYAEFFSSRVPIHTLTIQDLDPKSSQNPKDPAADK